MPKLRFEIGVEEDSRRGIYDGVWLDEVNSFWLGFDGAFWLVWDESS
jgi:hypothetical protein